MTVIVASGVAAQMSAIEPIWPGAIVSGEGGHMNTNRPACPKDSGHTIAAKIFSVRPNHAFVCLSSDCPPKVLSDDRLSVTTPSHAARPSLSAPRGSSFESARSMASSREIVCSILCAGFSLRMWSSVVSGISVSSDTALRVNFFAARPSRSRVNTSCAMCRYNTTHRNPATHKITTHHR